MPSLFPGGGSGEARRPDQARLWANFRKRMFREHVASPTSRGVVFRRLILTQTDLAPRHWDVLAGWHAFLRGLPWATDGAENPLSPDIEAEVRGLYRPR